jgi:MoaA/NifB/PqqE/SkfB family radical SAM enzyme
MTKTVCFSKHVSNIFFHILTQCNLNCRLCYINPNQHGTTPVSLETIEVWLKVFIKENKETNIIFLGGEPTLHPDLSLAVKKAKQLGCRSVTVDTNGYLFNNILAKVKPHEVDCFSFSLDGATKATNDMLRGKGSYDHILAGIKNAKAGGFFVSVIFTVSRHNLAELEMMTPLLIDLGVDRFFIQVIGIRGKSTDHQKETPDLSKLQVPKEQWLKIVPRTAQKTASAGIAVTFPKVFLEPNERFECAGLVADNYFIFPNGRVYRCPLCEDYPLHSHYFEDNELKPSKMVNEADLFHLNIPEGCVMNKIIQPENLSYHFDGSPRFKIACCMLKEEVNG